MTIKEITFKKVTLLGHAKNLTVNSTENQTIQSDSMMKNGSVMLGTSSSIIRVIF